jgi:hypothetical protein
METVNVVIAALDPVFAKVIGTLTQKADIPVPPGREGPEAYELLSRLSLAATRSARHSTVHPARARACTG